jgi:hypothetical protein
MTDQPGPLPAPAGPDFRICRCNRVNCAGRCEDLPAAPTFRVCTCPPDRIIDGRCPCQGDAVPFDAAELPVEFDEVYVDLADGRRIPIGGSDRGSA